MKCFLRIKTVILTVFMTSCCCGQSTSYLIMPEGAQGEINQNRESLERVYYELVKNGHFDTAYNNNLIINSSLQGNPQREGAILLTLIDWLVKHKNRDNRFLLKKINKLYFLELYSFIAGMDLKQEQIAHILTRCHQLFHFKTPGSTPHLVRYPFRTNLSRIFIVLTTVNANDIGYEERKKSLALVLDRIGQKMVQTNEKLGDKKIDTNDIVTFVSLLTTYGAKEPLIRPNNVKKIMLITMGMAALGALVYYNRERIFALSKDVSAKIGEVGSKATDELGQGLGKGVVKGVITELKNPESQLRDQLKQELAQLCKEAGGNFADAAIDITDAKWEKLKATLPGKVAATPSNVWKFGWNVLKCWVYPNNTQPPTQPPAQTPSTVSTTNHS